MYPYNIYTKPLPSCPVYVHVRVPLAACVALCFLRPCCMFLVVPGPVLVRGKAHKIRTPLRFIEEEPTFLTPMTTAWTGHSADTRPDLGRLYPGMPTLHHRFYFPETWLWDTTRIGSVGQYVWTCLFCDCGQRLYILGRRCTQH